MNNYFRFSVIVRDIKVGVVALHVICPVRVTVEEYNVMIFFKELSETSFVLVALEIRNCIEKTPVVINVAFTKEGVALRSIEEGMEIEVNSLILVFFKHLFKPILLLIVYNLNEQNVFVFNLAEDNEYIAVCLFTRVNEVISVICYVKNTCRFVLGKYADIYVCFP